MESSPFWMEHAVVIGASLSGLLAAQALAKHFQRVTLVERDSLPELGEPRKGVPQGRQVHVLLSHGRDLLEGFFPGLTAELARQGAVVGDALETVIWYSGGAYTRNFHSGLISVQVSRPLLEGTIYRRVCALPNVSLLENHDAIELLTRPEPNGRDVRVSGLRVAERLPSGPVEKSLPASLVVDAGGRGSRSLAWLENLGYERPAEELIKMGLSYTSRTFRRLPDHAAGKSPIVILPSFQNRRAAAMLAVEGERWFVGLTGYLGEAAPMDLPGFIEYARKLDAPDVFNVIKTAEPLGEPAQFKYPASQRRYFEKLNRFPEGFLVVGDAICSFNPIYGQGMTVAANEAVLLDECLRAGLPGIAKRFFQRAGPLLDSSWSIAAGSDLVYPEVEGKCAPGMGLIRAYLDRLLLASRRDTDLKVAFQRVTNLLDPPASLFRPQILLKVLMSSLKGSG